MSILKPGLTLIHEHTTIDLSRIKVMMINKLLF